MSRPAVPTPDEDFSMAQRHWTPSLPLDSTSSSSSSPPALEEGDGPPGLDDQIYDPLEQANVRYAMSNALNGFQGRAASPNSSSSNEAENGGSDSGASPPWGKRTLSDFVPSPPFAKAVLKPASFSPSYNEVNFPWGAGQEPPSPPSRSVSDAGDPRVAEHWDSDDATLSRRIQAGQLPSPDPEDLKS
jgi:ubiquitin carboxyl-terminal hydrolase 4/11/15